MGILILTETSAGYALFKSDSKALTATPSKIPSFLKLKRFEKFDSAAMALEEVDAIVNGKVTDKLANMLSGEKGKLVVADAKLGTSITKHPDLDFKLISDATTLDLHRAIRENILDLLPGMSEQDMKTMNLGLSHSLSRHHLKFSTDKIDTMIIQAISLLDDLDKEVNVYVMRLKEWYGWHFPEMAKIIVDGVVFAKCILHMGMRSAASNTDFAEILTEELEAELKAASEISMGTEIAEDDLSHIQYLAEQVVSLAAYRTQLATYLSARMTAIAPNLSALVGDLVGARLIAHTGSLINLAKAPASTIQILGAEKALFRALKTKHDTPKYGLIYHSSLIGQATPKNKGKIARLVATKAALSVRVDALSDQATDSVGIDGRIKIESRLFSLDGVQPRTIVERKQARFEGKQTDGYNTAADVLENKLIEEIEENDVDASAAIKADKKSKKRKSQEENGDQSEPEEETKEERRRRKEEKKKKKKQKKDN